MKKVLVINGPKFGFMTYNKIRETIGQFRFAEFESPPKQEGVLKLNTFPLPQNQTFSSYLFNRCK